MRQVREALQAHRYLLLRRREHLTPEQQDHVEALLASPLGPTLALARAFLLDWYAIWRTDDGQRRPLEEARARYAAWRTDAGYGTIAPLRRVQAQASDEHFGRVSPFLRDPRWEATNNGAERMGRAFRHQQAPHFNVRSPTSIDRAVAMAARQRKVAATMGPPPVAACRRGRAVFVPAVSTMAA